MRFMQQAIRTLSFALALLLLGVGYLFGDDPEPPFAAPDHHDVTETAGEQSGTLECLSGELPSAHEDEILEESTEAESSIGCPEIEPSDIKPAASQVVESVESPGAIQTATSGNESNLSIGATEYPQYYAYPVDASEGTALDSVPPSYEANNAGGEIVEHLSEEAPYPDVTEFPIPAEAFYSNPSTIGEPATASSWEQVEDGILDDNVTPAEYTADCDWLVEKLDGYRHAQSDSEPERFQETSSFVEVPQAPLGSELPEAAESGNVPYAETQQCMPVPTIADPDVIQSTEYPVQDAMVTQAERSTAGEIQQASATTLGQMIEPQVLAPPATIVPSAPLNLSLDQRAIAAIYGIFVGILATLFLLLIGLILRSLVNRVMPRSGNTPVGPAQDQSSATQPQIALPPHAQYVAYPHQQAYMPPVMMHPSFVYADVDHREQDQPRRPKSSKSKAKRKRRTAPAPKRNTRSEFDTQSPNTSEGNNSGSTSNTQSFELDSFDKDKTVGIDLPVQPGVFTKILEQNLKIRNSDGA